MFLCQLSILPSNFYLRIILIKKSNSFHCRSSCSVHFDFRWCCSDPRHRHSAQCVFFGHQHPFPTFAWIVNPLPFLISLFISRMHFFKEQPGLSCYSGSQWYPWLLATVTGHFCWLLTGQIMSCYSGVDFWDLQKWHPSSKQPILAHRPSPGSNCLVFWAESSFRKFSAQLTALTCSSRYSQSMDIFRGWTCYCSQWSQFRASQRSSRLNRTICLKIEEVLTFKPGDDLPGVNFELDGCLHQTGVVFHHFVIPLENEVFLNKVANVVKSASANVSTGSLQTMCQVLHLLIIVLFVWDNDILHGRIESHILEITQHHIEDLRLTTEALDCQIDIDGRRCVHLQHFDWLFCHKLFYFVLIL